MTKILELQFQRQSFLLYDYLLSLNQYWKGGIISPILEISKVTRLSRIYSPPSHSKGQKHIATSCVSISKTSQEISNQGSYYLWRMKIHTEKKKKNPQILSQLIQLFLQLVPGSLWIPKPTDTQVLYIKCRHTVNPWNLWVHPSTNSTNCDRICRWGTRLY